MKQGNLLEWACSLIFLEMLKAGLDVVVRWAPPGFMSSLYGEPLVQPEGLCLGFVVLKQNEKQARRSVCGLQQRATGCYGWLVSFLEGAKLHLLGELSFYQQERKITLLARHLTFSQSGEQREADECRGKTCPHCYARGLNYSCYRYYIRLIQAGILNMHIICNDLALTWSTIQFQDSASVRVLTYNNLTK